MKRYVWIGLIFVTCLLTGCKREDKMEDGFYTAEMAELSHGWQEYLCIMVKGDQIVYAEYNAKDESGYIKSWDNSYMQAMKTIMGTYPNEYTRNYVAQLLENQSAVPVDAISGASSSVGNFNKLAVAVVEQAKKGDTSAVFVE